MPAIGALALGGVLALAAQLAAPVGVPLYDGVPTLDPYRYLNPVGSQPGDPTEYTASPGLENGTSRAFVAATTEQPPQAQLIALAGALVPPSGATTMDVTIQPVTPEEQPTTGTIAGNDYRFEVVTDDGLVFTLSGNPKPTLTLRAPDGMTSATIGHLGGDGWIALPTEHAGALGLFQTEITELGDYAILAGVSPPSDLARLGIIGLTIALPLLAAIAYFYRRARRDRLAAQAAEADRARARIPSKRRRHR